MLTRYICIEALCHALAVRHCLLVKSVVLYNQSFMYVNEKHSFKTNNFKDAWNACAYMNVQFFPVM